MLAYLSFSSIGLWIRQPNTKWSIDLVFCPLNLHIGFDPFFSCLPCMFLLVDSEVWATASSFSLADLSRTVVWRVSILLFSSFPISFPSLGDHSKDINYNWHHCYFNVSQLFQLSCKIQIFSIFSLSFIFTLWSTGITKSTSWQVLFFLFINIRSGFQVGIGWSGLLSMSLRLLCISFSTTGSVWI